MSVRSPDVSLTVYAAIYYSLSIAVNKTVGYVGDSFTFTGRLMGFDPMAGSPFAVPNAVVNFYHNGVKAIGAFKTDSLGYYSIPWTASSAGTHVFYTEASTVGLTIESSKLSVGVFGEGIVVGNVASLLMGALGVLATVASIKRKR